MNGTVRTREKKKKKKKKKKHPKDGGRQIAVVNS
jgi:hypothetical protein